MLLTSFYSLAQTTKKTTNYSYGKNGIEYITKSKDETVVVSTFNSKPKIKDEIAINVYYYYKEKNPKSGNKISITANGATVKGTYFINKKGTLTAVEFHYEKIEWTNGLTEIYVKPNTTITASIAENDN